MTECKKDTAAASSDANHPDLQESQCCCPASSLSEVADLGLEPTARAFLNEPEDFLLVFKQLRIEAEPWEVGEARLTQHEGSGDFLFHCGQKSLRVKKGSNRKRCRSTLGEPRTQLLISFNQIAKPYTEVR